MSDIRAVLLANVGNRDLHVLDDHKHLLPEQDDPRYYTARRLGEEITANFKRYRDAIALPLIGPTLDWLLEEGYAASEIAIYLFASDQPMDVTEVSERLKDTRPVAEAIQLYLNYRYSIQKKAVRIEAIEGSPADYRNALNFYQQTLPAIQNYVNKNAPDAKIYAEVSGGTPAMVSMLILIAVEYFGEDVVTLYKDRTLDRPFDIGVARSLFARKTRDTLIEQIRLYAYAVAQRTLADHGQTVLPDSNTRQLLEHLLRYADRRLAFDYERAGYHLQEASVLATGTRQAQLRAWRRELNTDEISLMLAELVHSASLKLHLGDFADLTQRLFRFQEAMFRHMAEQMGLEYGKKSTQYASKSWVEANTAMGDFLAAYGRGNDGQPGQKPVAIDVTRSLNRYSLGAIVDYFVQHDTNWQHWQRVTEQIHGLSKLADLRNKGIAGHGFEGIGLDDLNAAYGASVATQLMNDLQQMYREVFDVELPPNPYESLNTICLQLLEPTQ